uniref:Eva-1 homolog B n=1 Tax=Salvator merianae TaxID=96440 RepID=A0A8D0CFZ9_SALMN
MDGMDAASLPPPPPPPPAPEGGVASLQEEPGLVLTFWALRPPSCAEVNGTFHSQPLSIRPGQAGCSPAPQSRSLEGFSPFSPVPAPPFLLSRAGAAGRLLRPPAFRWGAGSSRFPGLALRRGQRRQNFWGPPGAPFCGATSRGDPDGGLGAARQPCAHLERKLRDGATEGPNMNIQKQDMPLLSNSMAAYAHIRGNPESFGLYFVVGVCFGLVLTLCLLVIHISFQPRAVSRKPRKSLRDFSDDEEDDEEEEEDEEEDTVDHVTAEPPLAMTELAAEPHTTPEGTLTVNVFTSAEELERAQRLEERERILREIWRNGQPDILGTGTGTIGRVHYY